MDWKQAWRDQREVPFSSPEKEDQFLKKKIEIKLKKYVSRQYDLGIITMDMNKES